MRDKAVYLLVVDGFADWEPAHAVAELRRTGGYRIETVGLTAMPVESMGGIRVLPSTTVDTMDPADVAMFILPGGERWERDPIERSLVALLERLDAQGLPIAAICAATTAIARLGLIGGRRHTSNGLAYLQSQVPHYAEAAGYVDAPGLSCTRSRQGIRRQAATDGVRPIRRTPRRGRGRSASTTNIVPRIRPKRPRNQETKS